MLLKEYRVCMPLSVEEVSHLEESYLHTCKVRLGALWNQGHAAALFGYNL